METRAGAEVTPQMLRRLLESIVARMSDVMSRGGGAGELWNARAAEAQEWGMNVAEMESCLHAAEGQDPFLRSMLTLYKDLASRAKSPHTSSELQRSETDVCMDEETRRRKLTAWHNEAEDPDIRGRTATWAVPHWLDTCSLAKKGEGVWSEEFFCAGRCGLRLGVFPRGHHESDNERVGVLLKGNVGDEFNALIDVGGVKIVERLRFGMSTCGITSATMAGWPTFCEIDALQVEADGSLCLKLEIG